MYEYHCISYYCVFIGLEKAEIEPGDVAGSTHWRLKKHQVYSLTKRFSDVMNQYHQDCVAHKDRCKKAIQRELAISKYL